LKAPSFRYRLLFVGVNAVPGSPPLHAAARDAEAMSARFRGWGYDNPARHCLLLNQEATAARVLDEVRSASAAATLDLLLIYWAGHLHVSGRKHILTTHDDGTDGANGIGLDVITGAIGLAAGVPHRVLVLDTCNAAAAHPQLGALSRHGADDECVAVLAAGGTDAMSREDHRRGYFTGALLEQMPRDTRGLPPHIDVVQALRVGAEHLIGRRQEQPFIGIYGTETELRLPVIGGKTLPLEARGREGRGPGRSIAAHHGARA
jgi:caspase domain-containing protein